MRVAPGYRTSMQELRGKVAVVTGGGGGIGRALGERFLAEGMKVVLADIDEPGEKSTATVNARAASMRDASPPEYLVAPSPWNVPKT